MKEFEGRLNINRDEVVSVHGHGHMTAAKAVTIVMERRPTLGTIYRDVDKQPSILELDDIEKLAELWQITSVVDD